MYGEATRSPHRLALQWMRTECYNRNRRWESADIAARYGSRCQRRDTLSQGSRKPSSEEISQVMHMLSLAEQLAAKAMEMKLHRIKDVTCDYGLLKQHG